MVAESRFASVSSAPSITSPGASGRATTASARVHSDPPPAPPSQRPDFPAAPARWRRPPAPGRARVPPTAYRPVLGRPGVDSGHVLRPARGSTRRRRRTRPERPVAESGSLCGSVPRPTVACCGQAPGSADHRRSGRSPGNVGRADQAGARTSARASTGGRPVPQPVA